MSKIPQTSEQIKEALMEQMALLKSHISVFDDGTIIIALSIASVIRNIFHDGAGGTRSLLTQLNGRHIKLISIMGLTKPPSTQVFSYDGVHKHHGSHTVPLAQKLDSNSGIIFTNFANGAEIECVKEPISISIDDWLDQIIFIDNGVPYTRRSIYKGIADQGGGSHVDASLSLDVANMKHSTQWTRIDLTTQKSTTLPSFFYAALRNMAEELLQSEQLLTLTL